ncbi:MAG: B12-binding domain-containing radical SAM protein [Promethearchaeota archaeon]|jgi:anaerobic magnesium-protoporphyrin IX monomethyl ester cyclase
MKVCFINPAPRSYIIERGYETTGAYPPLGILYISAYLKENGYVSHLIDQHATKIPTTRVLEKVKKINPEIVAFNSLTDINMGKRATLIAKIIKDWNPNVKIAFGNYHATFNHDRLLKKYPHIDVCIRGEGEITFFELVRAIEENKSLSGIQGITYRENSKIHINVDRPLIENLDDLPFPDRDLCKDIEYRQNYGGFNADYGKFTTIQSSRGCSFNCTFCSQGKISNCTWRTRSIPRVIEELEMLSNDGYTNLYWVDGNLTNNPRRALRLFEEIKKNKLDFKWVCDQRVDLINNQLLYEMRKAGCRTLSFGIESANQRILDYFNKGFTPEIAMEATKKAKKIGIDFIMGTFIVGAPTETIDEIKNTFLFAQKLDIDFPQFHIFGALPGSEIWDRLVKEGKIDPDRYWENGVKTLAPPLQLVEEEMRLAYITFIKRPKYILRQIARTLRSKHRLRIGLSNLNNLKNVGNFYNFSTKAWTHGDIQ